MFVGIERFRIAFFLRDHHGNQFVVEETSGVRGTPTLLCAKREQILIRAVHLKIFRNIFGGFRHAVHAVFGFHQRIDEAPANGGIENFRVAAERAIGLAHHKRGARHTLHPADNRELGFARFDGPRGHPERIHAGSA